MEDRVKGSLFIISAAFLYSFLGVFSRFAGMDAFALVFYKVALSAFFFFLIFLFAKKDVRKLRIDWEMAGFFVPYGFIVAVTEMTFIDAYLNTGLTNAAFLNGLYPLFVVVLSFFFLREKISSKTLLSLFIGIAGIGFIVGADLLVMLSERNLFGDVLALVSALAYAAFIICGRERAKVGIDIYYSTFWSYGIAALFLLPVNLAYGSFAIPLESTIWIVILAFICTNIAFFSFCKGFEYINASKGGIIALSEQLFVVINALLFFGEQLSSFVIVGAVLVCSSVLLAER